jgi:Zn-dependent protease with chaperone function
MSQSSEPSRTNHAKASKGSHLTADARQRLLRQGTQALKSKDYPGAIAAFEALTGSQTPAAERLKATMGLIRAYGRQGNWTSAISYCQPLTRHPSQRVKAWAEQTLRQLQEQLQASVPSLSMETGSDAEPAQATQDRSGFIPLESTPVSPSGAAPDSTTTAEPVKSGRLSSLEADLSSSTDPKSASASTAFSADPSENPPHHSRRTSKEADRSTAAAGVHQDLASPPSASLFHYQRLNESSYADAQSPAPSGDASPLEVDQSGSVFPEDSSLPPPENIETAISDRLKAPQPLPPLAWHVHLKLWLVSGLSLAAFLITSRVLLNFGMAIMRSLIDHINWPIRLNPPSFLYHDHIWLLALIWLVLLLVSPWILDRLLQLSWGQQTLSTRKLQEYSPEALRLLRRLCQQRGWPFPALRLVPDACPICFSYGWLPRNTRIVVSQGLLNQLEDEEIACLYAYELGHSLTRHLPVMSAFGIVLVFLHQGYWQLAQWGNRWRWPWLRLPLGLVANLLYSLFWLLRKTSLWAARVGADRNDRLAVELTGNPHGHRRSLAKLMRCTAIAISQTRETSPWLEALDVLTPLSHQLALTPGSSPADTPLATLTQWDNQNPYRYWLIWNQPQPLLGERLRRLDQFAYQIGLPTHAPNFLNTSKRQRLGTRPDGLTYLPPLLLQGGPLVGLLIGLGVCMALWFVGGVVNAFNWFRLSWLYQDASILRGSLLLGFGIGMMVRINSLFPDILAKNVVANPDLVSIQRKPLSLPIDSQPIQLEGQLLGRRGIANWLNQDLIIVTETGLLKLHVLSAIGPLGNLFAGQNHPIHALHQRIRVTGWFRRGSPVWLDVDSLRTRKQTLKCSNLPLWTTFVSLATAFWGIYSILRG